MGRDFYRILEIKEFHCKFEKTILQTSKFLKNIESKEKPSLKLVDFLQSCLCVNENFSFGQHTLLKAGNLSKLVFIITIHALCESTSNKTSDFYI